MSDNKTYQIKLENYCRKSAKMQKKVLEKAVKLFWVFYRRKRSRKAF